jgi:hypothetical protein
VDELRVSYVPDDKWTGKVTVRVVAGQYSGEGSAWINPSQIANFARALGQFPMPNDHPAVFEGGHGGSLDGSRPPQTLVRVTVKPQGIRGHLVVCADLQTEIWKDEDNDLHQSILARFRTEYGLVERFSQSLDGLASGRVQEAILGGAGGG